MKIQTDFFRRDDVVALARDLLGKVICSQIQPGFTAGMITEVEAYAGVTDRASHAYNHRRTGRTRVMYEAGGVAYVYLCYGVHHLFNLVTGPPEVPHAILLRGIYPVSGRKIMEVRTGQSILKKGFSVGPGKVTRALGITVNDTGEDLTSNRIWLEDRFIVVKEMDIISGPRVGVDYAGEDAQRPYRFILANPEHYATQIKNPG